VFSGIDLVINTPVPNIKVENGKPNGLGVLIYPYNGKSIVGEWKNGKEWKTKHRTKNGSLILKFEMGKNGQVTFTSPDGRKYVGEWKDGKQNGQGKMTLPDGEKYEGKFKDGIPNGQGTYISPDGRMYVGEFKDGIPNGQGTYISPHGRMYVGELKLNGQGTSISQMEECMWGSGRMGN